MKKVIIQILFVILIPTLFGSIILIKGNLNQPDFYNEIKNAAKSSLHNFTKQIPDGYETKYGFNTKDEILNATIGNVYEVYTISPEFLNFPEMDKKLFVKPTEQFRVEVKFNKEVRTFITVEKVKGEYKAVDLGGADLSKELYTVFKSVNDNNPRRIIFRMYQIHCDFAVSSYNIDEMRSGVNEIESFNFYPITSSKITFGNTVLKKQRWAFDELIPHIIVKYSEKFDGGPDK